MWRGKLTSWVIRGSTFKKPLLLIHDVSFSQNTTPSMPIPQKLISYTSPGSLSFLDCIGKEVKLPGPGTKRRSTCTQNPGELKPSPPLPHPSSLLFSPQHLAYWTDHVVYLPLLWSHSPPLECNLHSSRGLFSTMSLVQRSMHSVNLGEENKFLPMDFQPWLHITSHFIRLPLICSSDFSAKVPYNSSSLIYSSPTQHISLCFTIYISFLIFIKYMFLVLIILDKNVTYQKWWSLLIVLHSVSTQFLIHLFPGIYFLISIIYLYWCQWEDCLLPIHDKVSAEIESES